MYSCQATCPTRYRRSGRGQSEITLLQTAIQFREDLLRRFNHARIAVLLAIKAKPPAIGIG
jgi:hypothetical protein